MLPLVFSLTCLIPIRCLLHPICSLHISFHRNHTSQHSYWPHHSNGSRWGQFSYSSWLTCWIWYCWSFHHRGGRGVSSWWQAFKTGLVSMSSLYLNWLVFILSHLSLSGRLHPNFHLIIFQAGSIKTSTTYCICHTSFHTLYNPIGSVISKNSTKCHLFTDETQL